MSKFKIEYHYENHDNNSIRDIDLYFLDNNKKILLASWGTFDFTEKGTYKEIYDYIAGYTIHSIINGYPECDISEKIKDKYMLAIMLECEKQGSIIK